MLAPALRKKRLSLTVGRWENLSLAIARASQRSRGTGTRATGGENPSPPRRARACPSPYLGLSEIAGDRPPHYGEKTPISHRRAWALACHTRLRAGFPRRVSVYRKSRGTGPRATGGENLSLHRRARACPSPCCDRPNTRGGQAPALRENRDQEVSPTGNKKRLAFSLKISYNLFCGKK